jgi:glutathione S-transferase
VLRAGGRGVGDSTAIIALLEERWPTPPLYPADPELRARALALEDFLDEELGAPLRAFAWHHVLGERGGIGDSIAPTRPLVRRTLNAAAPVAARIIRGDYGATAEREAETRAQIVAAADRLERELGPSGYLAGDAFSVADLTAAALFTPVLQPPGRPYLPEAFPAAVVELREELEARETGRWVAEMYARHRGAWQRAA